MGHHLVVDFIGVLETGILPSTGVATMSLTLAAVVLGRVGSTAIIS